MQTILLIEDDAAVRKVLRHMLSSQNYQVLEAGDAGEAFRVAAGHPDNIDLVITDVVMPRTNCDQLIERLRTDRPNLKVIYISGYEEEVLKNYGISNLESNFLQKPFTADALRGKVREVLEQRGRLRRAGSS